MLSKKYIERIQSLKVGDLVTIYDAYGNNLERMRTRTSTIEKIGKQYIWSCGCKFDKEKGYGEFSKQIFPGQNEEFVDWFNSRDDARKIASELNRYADCLEKEDIKTIEEILNRVKP